MSDTKLTIDRDRRDGLYEMVRNHLGAIGDFWLVFEQHRDYAAAERMGLEFAADFRLLQDIGWAEQDSRERYVLTMPPEELTGLLLRLQASAVGFLIEVRTPLNGLRSVTSSVIASSVMAERARRMPAAPLAARPWTRSRWSRSARAWRRSSVNGQSPRALPSISIARIRPMRCAYVALVRSAPGRRSSQVAK